MENCITLAKIVIAPTAISPPYLCREVLKQTDRRLSVDCIIKGETPSAKTGPIILKRNPKLDLRIWRIVLEPHRKRTTQTADTA